MTFIYELDLYSQEIYQMCENEFIRQGFRKLSYYAFSYAWSLLVPSLDLYSLEIYRMCKYELHRSRLLKVLV